MNYESGMLWLLLIVIVVKAFCIEWRLAKITALLELIAERRK